MLTTATRLCLTTATVAAAVAFPMNWKDEWLEALAADGRFGRVLHEIYAYITPGISPLLLKESLFFLSVLGALFFWLWGTLAGMGSSEAGTGRSFTLAGLKRAAGRPMLWLVLLGVASAPGVLVSPTFYQSTRTLALAAAGLALFGLTGVYFRSRRQKIAWMIIIILVGTAIAGLAVLQHLGKGWLLPAVGDPRNRIGSLIGHNTGLTAFLYFPLSFALYFGLTNRRTWARAAGLLFSALMVFVIIAAQSRAGWLLGGAMGGLVVWGIGRLHGKTLRAPMLLAGALVLVASVAVLTLAPGKNPFARLPVSMAERVRNDVFNQDQLRRETRLRILTVSLSEMVPTAPILGQGLGTFQWYYPLAQGQYFASNPETRLGTTARRTDLAHNDYLQLLTETGLVGLGLTLVALWRWALTVRRSMGRTYARHERALTMALAAPCGAMLVHALVDFPFHVVPLAAVFLQAGAMAMSNREVISREVVRPRKFLLAGLGALALMAWSPWLAISMVAAPLVSDINYANGNRWMENYRKHSDGPMALKLSAVERARRFYRAAIVTHLFNGAAYEGQASAYAARASLLQAELDRLRPELSTSETEAMSLSVKNSALASITALENQVKSGELRYHYTSYLTGRAWLALWYTKPDHDNPAQRAYLDRAVEAFQKSLFYNPANGPAMRELSDIYQGLPEKADEAVKLRKQIFKMDPIAADDLYLWPARQLAAQGEVESAEQMIEPLVGDLAGNPRLSLTQAWLLYYKAVWPPPALDTSATESAALEYRRQALAPARKFLEAALGEARLRPEHRRLSMLTAGAVRDLPRARALAEEILLIRPDDVEAQAVKFWADAKLTSTPLRLTDSVDYYRTRALLGIYFMDDPHTASMQLGELAFRERLTLPEARRLMAYYRANAWYELIAMVLPRIISYYSDDRQFQELAAETEARGHELKRVDGVTAGSAP